MCWKKKAIGCFRPLSSEQGDLIRSAMVMLIPNSQQKGTQLGEIRKLKQSL
jgi:hypothetical protein